MDDIVSLFLSKMNGLQKVVDDPKNYRDVIKTQIAFIKQWLIGDRSFQQLKMYRAWMTYLYNSHGSDYTNVDDFIDGMKLQAGFCRTTTSRIFKDKKEIIKIKYKPDSTSYAKCGQKKFSAYIETTKEIAMVNWKCNFDKWFVHYEENENTI